MAVPHSLICITQHCIISYYLNLRKNSLDQKHAEEIIDNPTKLGNCEMYEPLLL